MGMFYGNTFKVECPTGSGEYMHLGHVAEELQHRLQHLMARNGEGRRAYNDGRDMLDFGPDWKDNLWFYEFFDGDTGRLPQTPRTPTTTAAHYFDDVFSRQRRASL